jgi:two-component system C4-dicarboxylate transport sensor histidine kinase DctB
MGTGAGGRGAGHALEVELGGRRWSVDELAHVNRMMSIGLVLPNAAHEVNNALQVVSGLVEMLGAREDLPDAVQDKLRRIGVQVGRATTLVRELVTYTRRDHATVGRVDVARLAEAALAMRRYHLSRDRVTVVTRTACDPPAWCHADGHYLQQAIVNLILNAEQALRGRPEPRVSVVVEAGPDEVAVIVEDNGRGLQGEAAARAGEPFFSTGEACALGLGVTVARALAEMHGGRLELAPAGQQGTRACLCMPRAGA